MILLIILRADWCVSGLKMTSSPHYTQKSWLCHRNIWTLNVILKFFESTHIGTEQLCNHVIIIEYPLLTSKIYTMVLLTLYSPLITKINWLKEAYSVKFLEPTGPRCQMVLVIMSRCMNFTVFSFVMASINKKARTIWECYVASIV